MLVRRAADAQLTVAVVAPAHEAASSNYSASVTVTRCCEENGDARTWTRRHRPNMIILKGEYAEMSMMAENLTQ